MKQKLLWIGVILWILLLAQGAGYRPAAQRGAEGVMAEIARSVEMAEETAAEEGEPGACEPDPDGSVLTMSGGVNYYYDQKETYYNLNMDGVVSIAHDQGIEGEYWVREDGCKMLGDYIMVAANLDVHPRGSLVPTSLGMGVVVDTGGFAAGNPTQVDIAVDW